MPLILFCLQLGPSAVCAHISIPADTFLHFTLNLEWLGKEAGSWVLGDVNSHFAIRLINMTLCSSMNTQHYKSKCVFCAVPCSSVSASFFKVAGSIRRARWSQLSGMVIIHARHFHRIADFIWMSSHYWEDLSIGQACSSQHWRGLVSLWKGHKSSEAHHLIRKETCHKNEGDHPVLLDMMRMALTSQRWLILMLGKTHPTLVHKTLRVNVCLNFDHILF